MNSLFVKDKHFYKLLITLALPVILQNMITIGVNIFDTIMLGSFGEIQLSGSSLANDFINLFQILCMGVGSGATVLSSQYFGRSDYKRLKQTVAIMLRFISCIALVCMLLTFFLPDKIMSIYTSDIDVIEKGVIYFKWSVPTFFLMGITMTLTLILRSIHDVKIPLYASIGSFCINLFFNWVFIFGNLGAPRMEIAGAALGTLLARLFEFIVIAGYFFMKEKTIAFKVKDVFVPTKDLLKTYFKYSIPVLCSDVLLGTGNSMVSIVIGHIGTSFVAANSIVAMVQRLCTVITQGIGQASSIITGNAVGAKEVDRAYKEAKTMIVISVLLGFLTSLVLWILGPFIFKFYNISQETLNIAYQMLYAIMIMNIFQCMQSVLTKGVLRGGGDTKFCMLVDATFLWLVSVPLGWVCGVTLGMSAFITYIALKIDWAIKVIFALIRFKSKKWIKVV